MCLGDSCVPATVGCMVVRIVDRVAGVLRHLCGAKGDELGGAGGLEDGVARVLGQVRGVLGYIREAKGG